jgi:hypothetical protein
MRDWDAAFYGRLFNQSCRDTEMPVIDYPAGELPMLEMWAKLC